MSFWWEPTLAPGAATTPDDLAAASLTTRFDDQLEAEEWLTEGFAELADLGVTSVTLIEDGTTVYSMGLDTA